ncbi:hypothetical protein ACFQI7_15980 [Paenibacillus allorhizosphaerae]|uniref:Uncharacterized protein n=1 Tax=Paenibacillus allorhizosphaerae TaxID=2849866 RepID=A0ABN7TEW8_9BACL|nr:hypothetical protein [Paenibacillus allorhizosphaerae]CAG7629616.1 hypothetical protein PAECIP111802_01572 [Paenibacillus allorhizosphaerae]
MLGLVLACSLFALSTVFWLKRYLHPLEIVSYWCFIASFEQMFFTITTLNLNYVQYDGHPKTFWILKQTALIINPSLVLWSIAWIVSVRSMVLRLLSFAICLGMLMIGDGVLAMNKLLLFSNWSFTRSALLFALIFTLSAAFTAVFRALMRREGFGS